MGGAHPVHERRYEIMANESDQDHDGKAANNDGGSSKQPADRTEKNSTENQNWQQLYEQVLAENKELKIELKHTRKERDEYLLDLIDYAEYEIPELAAKKGQRPPMICHQSLEELV